MGCQKSGGAATGVCVCPTGVGDEGQEVASHRSDAVCCWWGHTHTKPRGGGQLGVSGDIEGGQCHPPCAMGPPGCHLQLPPVAAGCSEASLTSKQGGGCQAPGPPPRAP